MFEDKPYNLIKGDCLEVMKTFDDNSIDVCITDIPYGTTACKWDEIIPFEPMWEALKRIVKPKGAICLFGSQPFTSALIMSNPKMFKYEWIWNKKLVSNVFQAKRQPLRNHENILIFCKQSENYYPQKTGKALGKFGKRVAHNTDTLGNIGVNYTSNVGYPKSIIVYQRPFNLTDGGLHETQKPVKLMQYLVKTYTKENETVLDFTMGSGTTGAACMIENRKFLGIEKDSEYFKIAQARIKRANLEPCDIPQRQKKENENDLPLLKMAG